MQDQLEQAKEALKSMIRQGSANGINGVGIDPFEKKLLVFYTDREEAQKTLQALQTQIGGDFLSRVDLHSGNPPPEPGEASRAHLACIFKRILAVFQKNPLAPVSEIRPSEGIKGRVGCFVTRTDGKKAVITVEHIFFYREEHIVGVRVSDSFFKPAGSSWTFGVEDARVDCALFRPDLALVDLKKDQRITGRYIDEQSIKHVKKSTVTTLIPRADGKVLDVDAMIEYDIVFGDVDLKKVITKKVVFDGQILIKGEDFGVRGDSGSLVVMKEDEPDKGVHKWDALGLYSYRADRKYHYAAPLYSCFEVLKVASIDNP